MRREIVSALKRRGVLPARDGRMAASMKTAVRHLCAKDVVCARLLEREAKETGSVECSTQLRRLAAGGKVYKLASV